MDIPWDDVSVDDIIDDKIEEAQGIIDTLTQTTFEAVSGTKYFDTYADVDEDGLLIVTNYDWLLSLTTLLNGDGEDITSDTFLRPSNKPPYFGIGLKSETWATDSDGYPQDAIAVTGYWGWSTSAPYDIRQATTELAAFLVQTRRNPTQQAIQFAEGGQIIVPRAWPQRVWATCLSYLKRAT